MSPAKKRAKKAQKPKGPKLGDKPQLCSIVYSEDYQGPAQRSITLPHGGLKKMNLLEDGSQKPGRNAGQDAIDRLGDYEDRSEVPGDYPYFEWELTAAEARSYQESGFDVQPIASSNYPEKEE